MPPRRKLYLRVGVRASFPNTKILELTRLEDPKFRAAAYTEILKGVCDRIYAIATLQWTLAIKNLAKADSRSIID